MPDVLTESSIQADPSTGQASRSMSWSAEAHERTNESAYRGRKGCRDDSVYAYTLKHEKEVYERAKFTAQKVEEAFEFIRGRIIYPPQGSKTTKEQSCTVEAPELLERAASTCSRSTTPLPHEDLVPNHGSWDALGMEEIADHVNPSPDPLVQAYTKLSLSKGGGTLGLNSGESQKNSLEGILGSSALVHTSSQTTSSNSDQSTIPDVSSCSEASSGVVASIMDELEARKKGMIARIMLQFYEMFSGRGAAGNDSTNSSHVPNTMGPSSRVSSSQQYSDAASKKRNSAEQRKDNDDNDDNDDDDKNSRKRSRRTAGEIAREGGVQRRLACPYFKHNPGKYQSKRCCLGPGWPTVHRVKEHLYRRHTLGPQCPRCCQTFGSESDVATHLRSESWCMKQEQDPPEGLDKTQIETLKRRQNMFRAATEEDKWKVVYLIVFPNLPLTELPSPYYEYDAMSTVTGDTSPKPADLVQYEAYLSRELPRIVRQEVEKTIEKWIGPIEETVKNELESIVRDSQEKLSRNYQKKSQGSPRQSLDEDSVPSYSETTGDQATISAGLLEVPAPYALPMDTLSDLWAGVDFQAPQKQENSTESSYFPDLQNFSSGVLPDLAFGLEIPHPPEGDFGYINAVAAQPQFEGWVEQVEGKGKAKEVERIADDEDDDALNLQWFHLGRQP